jgi:hypothetical protein
MVFLPRDGVMGVRETPENPKDPGGTAGTSRPRRSGPAKDQDYYVRVVQPAIIERVAAHTGQLVLVVDLQDPS